MSAATLAPIYAPSDLPHFPLSVEQYEEMIRLGVLDEDDPVELIDGVLVFKMSVNEPHETSVGNFQDILPGIITGGWVVRLQASLILPTSVPEPDVAIVRGKRNDYSKRRPTPRDAALVVEVAESTLADDRTRKLRMYAQAGVVEYWIVNLIDRQIEVHTQPTGNVYASRVVFASTDTIALPATLGGATIAVADLLPPA